MQIVVLIKHYIVSIKAAIDLTGKPGERSVYKRADMDGSLVRMPGEQPAIK